MRKQTSIGSWPATLLLSLLSLTACDRLLSDPATARAEALLPGNLPVTPSMPDPSVPSATSAFAASAPASAVATAKDEPAARVSANGTLTPAQESAAMPIPGQVNNHSTTALDPANSRRAASAP